MKSFHEIEAYLRWVANCDLLMRNINDWEKEKSESKIIEETICYKNLEWSFSCSKGDFAGHKHKKEGQKPHYHFQMKVDGKVVMKYRDFHIPFHDYDFFCFAAKNGAFPKLSYQHIHGSGIQKMFDHYTPEQLLDLMNTKHMTDGKEQFRLETLIMAEEGKTISGEKIAELMEKKKKTGIPLAKLVQEMEGVRVVTTVSPGADIPEIAKRTPRKKPAS